MRNIKSTLLLALLLNAATLFAARAGGQLENDHIRFQWDVNDGKLQPTSVEDRLSHQSLSLAGECFEIQLGNGTVLKASDFKLVGEPKIESLKRDRHSPTLSRHESGKQLLARFSAPEKNLTAEWRVILRENSSYLREELTLRATGRDALVKEIVLFNENIPGAKTLGSVDGSPVVAGQFFIGYEHPMARNAAAGNSVRCSFLRNAVLKAGETLTQSCVVGVTPEGQLRRGFLAYIERERVHPYRPFLHYNSWFDIAWDKQKYDEAKSLDAIDQFGLELVKKRGVKMDSFLFDDGWDDNTSLWKFHQGFPNGFAPLKAEAAKFNSGIGIWLSPFGGYDVARQQRLKYGTQFGYETNASGFSLAGPKYYQRFHDICLEMVEKYGVNQFKFDGLAAGAKASESGLTRDGDAMLRLVEDLRAAKPDIYINETTGTWPSPFWLLYVDSTWRGGADHDFYGKGSARQQWITYRDQQTYRNVVQRGPLYPLNSLMLHGMIYATNASRLTDTSDSDFADEVHSFFGGGTQLQEMYFTPRLLNARNWDDVAEAAKWSRANAKVLVDTHWIGGDPGKGEVYGWASWTPRKAIVVLRNPDDKTNRFTFEPDRDFELPANAEKSFHLRSPWKADRAHAEITIATGESHPFELKPFEVLVLETR